MKIVTRVSTVDTSKCVGCKSCESHCVTGAIRVRAGVNDEAYVSPCQQACPAGINVPGYIALAAAGRYEDAYKLIRRDNPFPSVCGRICTHPCELKCNRASYDSAVAIRDIKRFVSDKAFENGVKHENVWPATGKSVAVIGAGPSGLSCAYYLALSGYAVDVYDSAPVAGGVLSFGIPTWRLPRDIIDREVKAIEAAGVRIHLNTEIGKDVEFAALQEKYDAIYIATGTQFSKKAGVEGEDLPGVTHGLDFLRDVNLGKDVKVGKKVVVIGGGNTAMDAARTAVRLGAESVSILYRRREVDMPAEKREVMEAKEEGVKIIPLSAPLAFEGDGAVSRIRCNKMTLGERDESGRRSVVKADGQEFFVDADTVIVAVSQYSDFPFINKDEVEMTEWGKLVIDESMMTTMDGVFSGGDVTRGSATAIEAIADGKKAAESIAKYLGLATPINQGAEIQLPDRNSEINRAGAGKMRNLPAAERIKSNDEVALGLTEEMLHQEALRCYRCSGRASVDAERCIDCGLCWEHCSHEAITMRVLEQPIIHQTPLAPPERNQELFEICRKAHVYPEECICYCSLTSAAEIISAILAGAHTLEDLALATGVRGGCSFYCSQELLRIFDAAGYPQTPRDDGSWYKIDTNLWTITEEQSAFDPHLQIARTQKEQWNDEKFEAACAAYAMKQQEGAKHEQ